MVILLKVQQMNLKMIIKTVSNRNKQLSEFIWPGRKYCK